LVGTTAIFRPAADSPASKINRFRNREISKIAAATGESANFG
jgi:hypothetical protein